MKTSYFPEGGQWLRGILHCHSTVTDGSFSPEELVRIYKEAGYSFLTISDHNILKLHKQLEDEDFVLLSGLEHDLAYTDDKCVHLVGTMPAGREATGYDCRRYSPEELSAQQLTDMMKADGQFVGLAHPVWSRMDMDEVLELEGFDGIEVYNSDSEHHSRGGLGEIFWEMLLRRGRKVWALAADDTHGEIDLFGGWLMVRAEKNESAILEALRSGSFYASCGPEIFDFGIEDGKVYVDCSDCREIHFVTYPPRGRSCWAKDGEMLTHAEHSLSGRESYVHVICADEKGRCAWSNPIFFD